MPAVTAQMAIEGVATIEGRNEEQHTISPELGSDALTHRLVLALRDVPPPHWLVYLLR